LLARIRAHLRDTSKPQTPSVLDDGYLLIDTGKRNVTVAGKHAGLTPKEYAVLAALAKVPNCVITQSQLLLTIWGPTHEQDTHYLRIVISHLRQKLGDDPTEPRYIRTESGVGYRLVWDAALPTLE
jgi:two-component system KDP operon response regulator KdpE